jgi:hypothetical protein
MQQTSLPVLIPKEGDFYRNVPFWARFNVAFLSAGMVRITAPDGTTTDVALDAALTQTLALVTVDPKTYFGDAILKNNVVATGTATLTATLGVTGTVAAFLAAQNLQAAVADTTFGTTGAPVILTLASIDVEILLTATTDNLDSISAMNFDVFLLISTLPS